MRDEEDDLLLSQLTHGSYCLRRFALVTNELIWAESTDTAKGRMEHERTHTRRMERRGSEIKLYGFEVHSRQMGLHGTCDCIEASESPDGCMVPGIPFPVRLYPVEYKHGRVRQEEEYELQLCAQAMCLEEMFQTEIGEGSLYYTSSHRRYPVKLTRELRQKVNDMVCKLREIRASYLLPKAEYARKLNECADVDSMRGVEGAAGAAYFACFDQMLSESGAFRFGVRSRRPPANEVNAVLSFLYVQMTHDMRSALEGVGLDPYAGYLHTLRPGRPSLALDLIEELRSPLCDRLTLTLFNRGQLSKQDFQDEGEGVYLNEKGRRRVLQAWRERKHEEIRHPFLDEKLEIGMIAHVQAMLLARVLRGDLDRYPPFVWR